MPSYYDEDFREEIMVEVLFSQIYHVKEWSSSLPLNANLLPTGSCKGTAKEKMKSSFFSLSIAKNTVVVILLNLEFFSFQETSSV
jgi:hypothetical protein